jgi:hypothetical protein
MRNDIAARARLVALTIAVCSALPALASAQGARRPAVKSCAPRATAHEPAFVFGNEGGNLKRVATKLWADGSAQLPGGRRTAPDPAIADSVAALARFARQSSFWTTIAPKITRPTRNPDMARHYVDAHLQCGTKRSLYPADTEPAPFHELFTRLAAVADLAAAR